MTIATAITSLSPARKWQTGREVRLAARENACTTPTAGLAPTYLQANLIILPSKYARDFRDLCARNPVACPLIAESSSTGSFSHLKSHLPSILDGQHIANPVDIRTDCPKYNVYRDGRLIVEGVTDIKRHWTEDHVAFAIGCSFSFESALAAAGLPTRHTIMGRNVPMYRTNIPLNPAGVFVGSNYVVSMRPYKKSEVERVRVVTRRYLPTHGECIAWGWDAVSQLGIESIDRPTWGDAPLTMDGRPLGEATGDEEDVPLFWACGVTPQEAILRTGLEGVVMSHSPGHMLLLDCKEDDVLVNFDSKL